MIFLLCKPKQTKTDIGQDVRIKKRTLGEVFDLGGEHWVVSRRQRWGLEVSLEGQIRETAPGQSGSGRCLLKNH